MLNKTKNGAERTVPLSLSAVKTLKLAIENPLRPEATDLVFFGEMGKKGRYSPYSMNKVFGLIKSSIGMADYHFHDLRHEAISRLVEARLTDQQVAAISGHKSMQMLKRYTHLRAKDLVIELDRIDKALQSS